MRSVKFFLLPIVSLFPRMLPLMPSDNQPVNKDLTSSHVFTFFFFVSLHLTACDLKGFDKFYNFIMLVTIILLGCVVYF